MRRVAAGVWRVLILLSVARVVGGVSFGVARGCFSRRQQHTTVYLYVPGINKGLLRWYIT